MSTQPKDGILENEVLTVKEVAIYLRVNRVTVWRWCQQGIIPASRFGRNWRIRKIDLLLLLENTPSTSIPVPLYPANKSNATPQGLPLLVLGLDENDADSNLDGQRVRK
jgi:excisionase family DNA binding protein